MTASVDLNLTRDKLHIGGAWVAPAGDSRRLTNGTGPRVATFRCGSSE